MNTYSQTLGVNLSRMHIRSGMDVEERRANDAVYRAQNANARSFAERARAARGQAKPCSIVLRRGEL